MAIRERGMEGGQEGGKEGGIQSVRDCPQSWRA